MTKLTVSSNICKSRKVSHIKYCRPIGFRMCKCYLKPGFDQNNNQLFSTIRILDFTCFHHLFLGTEKNGFSWFQIKLGLWAPAIPYLTWNWP